MSYLEVLGKKNLRLRCIYKIFTIYSTSNVFYIILCWIQAFIDVAQFEHHAQSNTDTDTQIMTVSVNTTGLEYILA